MLLLGLGVSAIPVLMWVGVIESEVLVGWGTRRA